jgi:hypothetical protein
MAGLAMLLKNPDDLVVEGYITVGARLTRADKQEQNQSENSRRHDDGFLLYHWRRMGAISVFMFMLAVLPAQSGIVPAGTVVKARLESAVDTGRSSTGDEVVAVVSDSIRLSGKVVVPEGSRLNGRVESLSAATSTSEGRVRLAFRQIQFPDGRSTSTWITDSFSAPPSKRGLRYAVYVGLGAAAGAFIGGKRARVAGILGGTLGGFVIASNSEGRKLPEVVLKRGRTLNLRLGEDLTLDSFIPAAH